MDKKTSKAISEKRTNPATLRYLRGSGAIGIVLGFGGLILSSILFWWGTGFVYGALLVWLIDVTLEPELSKPTKGAFLTGIIAIAVLFTVGIVTFPAPLELSSSWIPDGVAVNGINWTPETGALVAYISNRTNRDYSDLDISLWVHEGIVTVKQVTDIPCALISENVMTAPAGWNHMFEVGPQRFRCDKVPEHSTIEFVLVLVNPDELLRKHSAGDRLPGGFFGPKRKPSQFGVVATYNVAYRPHAVSTLVKIN